jgi:Na+/citrate or Na+/malate symporter
MMDATPALLLHLGDILEAISCMTKCGHRRDTIGEAYAQEETLASSALHRQIDAEMTAFDFAMCAASAFFLWKELLDEGLDLSCSTACLPVTMRAAKLTSAICAKRCLDSATALARYLPLIWSLTPRTGQPQ